MTLSLILHKVRGQPALDVARPYCPTAGASPCQPKCGCWSGTSCLMEGEWIIPTSGHIAYPIETWDLGLFNNVMDFLTQPLPEVRDHYEASASPKPAPIDPGGLLAQLGLAREKKPINRRKI